MKTFAQKLSAERKRLGISQAELAALLDVHKRTVEHWLHGTGEPAQVAQEGALARLATRSADPSQT